MTPFDQIRRDLRICLWLTALTTGLLLIILLKIWCR